MTIPAILLGAVLTALLVGFLFHLWSFHITNIFGNWHAKRALSVLSVAPILMVSDIVATLTAKSLEFRFGLFVIACGYALLPAITYGVKRKINPLNPTIIRTHGIHPAR